ncbi:PREDICTED: sialin-like, partial [Ceratosolen solmsi marchali]
QSHPSEISDSQSCIKSRQIFGFLGFLGFALVYAMRVNLSVAIVSMVNQSAIPHSDNESGVDACPKINPVNTTFVPSAGEFAWDEKTQGIILGAFFLGYVITNVPGGRVAEKIGGKLVYGLGVFLTSLLTVISPFAAYWGLYPFLVIRVAEGFTEGVTFPAMHSMLAHWVPPLERSKFAALVYAGSNFEHPRIDPQEKLYIESLVETKNDDYNNSVPWLSIFKSLPMWAIAITQCGQSWAFYTLLTELPTYMDRILHFDVQQDAFLSALPYLTAWVIGLIISSFADALLARNIITPLTSFKLWNTIASLGPSLSFLGAIWAGCDRLTVMLMLSGLSSLYGAVYAGNQMNHIVLAPRFAGTLYGITNAAANTCGFLAPYIIGQIVNGH